jgi:hypothetical protein
MTNRRLPPALLAVGLLLARATGDAPGQVPATPRVLSRATVFAYPRKDPYDRTNLYGFNHAPSVTLLPDGRLLTAWFSGPFEASVHQVILGSYSTDGGKTWDKAEVLQDFPRRSDFDPAFLADGKRTWFFFSAGRWNRYPFVRDEKEHVGVNSWKTYARTSDDSGKTWSEPVLIAKKNNCRSNGIKLSTGELILPVQDVGSKSAGVLRSADGGKTWKRHGSVSTSTVAAEPSVAELKSGALRMVLRTRDGFLWQSTSRDRGKTWSKAEKTGMRASYASHNLFRLADGRLALTHNDCPTPLRTLLTLRLSTEDGGHWGKPLALARAEAPGKDDPVWSRQVTYPSVAQLPDGTLVVVWAAISISNTEQFGIIRSARVRVD